MRVELDVEQLVVVAKLQQLRVGKLEDLEGGLHTGLGVEHEGRVPRRHDEVIGQVGQPVVHHLVALLAAERLAFAADQAGNLLGTRRHEILGGRRRLESGHRHDQVVFAQQRLATGCHRRRKALEEAARDRLRMPFEIGVLDVDLAQANQLGPFARERSRQPKREDSVVEELGAKLEPVDIVNIEHVAVHGQGRRRVLQIGGRRGFGDQARAGRAATNRATKRNEINLLGNVEQVEGGESGGGDCGHRGTGGTAGIRSASADAVYVLPPVRRETTRNSFDRVGSTS